MYYPVSRVVFQLPVSQQLHRVSRILHFRHFNLSSSSYLTERIIKSESCRLQHKTSYKFKNDVLDTTRSNIVTTCMPFAYKLNNYHGKRCYSDSSDTSNEVDFIPFYQFPNITIVRLFNRLKLYQTAVTIAFCPVVVYMYSIGKLGVNDLLLSTGTSVFALAMLYIITGMARKFVGVISITPDKETIRIGHLDFWSKRTNTFIKVENIVPLSDIPDRMDDIYIKIQTYDSDKQSLYLTLKYGVIKDPKIFNEVFGKIM